MYIIHVANKELFEKEIRTGAYGRDSLKRCGFIHCSDLDTYYLVAPNFRNDPDEKVILVIDTGRLVPEVKWEDGGGLDFPHIYGQLKQYAPDGFRREWNG